MDKPIKQSKRAERSQLFQRPPRSIPSIPTSRQIFGVSVNHRGQAVLESSIVYSGEKSDSVGPAYYRIHSILGSGRGPVWHKSPVKKTVDSSLGPGSYSEVLIKDTKPNAAFKSSVRRPCFIPRSGPVDSDSDEETGIPGPGYYYRPQVLKKQPKPCNYSSKVERFSSKKPSSRLGPGYYSSMRDSKISRKLSPCFLAPGRKETKQRDSPGPGSYINTSSYNVKRTSANIEAFGFTGKRFVYNNRSNDSPGPGHYSVDSQYNNSKPSPVFLSKEQRDTPVPDYPPPGSYYSEYGNIGSQNYNENFVGFNSQAQRFNSVKRDGVDPGKYFVQKKETSNVYLPQAKRFNYKIEDGPGPGTYDEVFPWKKSSFNIVYTDMIL